jgi:hypothetical protein
MIQLLRFLAQIQYLLLFNFLIKTVNGDPNYRLTSVFYGNEGYSMDQVDNFTSWNGKRPAVVIFYTS